MLCFNRLKSPGDQRFDNNLPKSNVPTSYLVQPEELFISVTFGYRTETVLLQNNRQQRGRKD